MKHWQTEIEQHLISTPTPHPQLIGQGPTLALYTLG